MKSIYTTTTTTSLPYHCLVINMYYYNYNVYDNYNCKIYKRQLVHMNNNELFGGDIYHFNITISHIRVIQNIKAKKY
jgi:hypothetical protein